VKNIVIILLLAIGTICQAQIINSITYLPQSPQPGDTLTILCNVNYPYPNCPLMEKNIYLGGDAIFAEAFHCQDSTPGPQILCPSTDTFRFKTLDTYIGVYPFYYMPGYHDEAPCIYPYTTSGQPLPHPYVIGHINIEVGTVSTDELEQIQNLLKISPNPATDQVIIHWQGENYQDLTVEIYDMTGKQVRQLRFDYGNILKVNTSEWQNGLYLIRLVSDKGIASKKLIIQH
jgi:hypothetical protein